MVRVRSCETKKRRNTGTQRLEPLLLNGESSTIDMEDMRGSGQSQ